MGFNLDDYEPVKDRISRFYADHKDGRIITDLISAPETLGSYAAFRASIFLGDLLKATGFAYEAQGKGVNSDAWVENAETSAIGRALANMDYCGDLRPSREEMSKVANKATATPDYYAQLKELDERLGKIMTATVGAVAAFTDAEREPVRARRAAITKVSAESVAALNYLVNEYRDKLEALRAAWIDAGSPTPRPENLMPKEAK